MIGLATQLGGNGSEAGSSSALGPFLVIVGAAVAVGLALALSEALRPRIHAVLRRRRSRRARVAASVDVERRARAMMSELCPYGWRAQLTLHDVRSDEAARDAVALDWYELRPGGGEPAVMRRVWAASVAEALEAMVSDRRTDETLEQIELRATAGGAQWPDL